MDDKTLPMVNTGKYTHRQHYTVFGFCASSQNLTSIELDTVA